MAPRRGARQVEVSSVAAQLGFATAVGVVVGLVVLGLEHAVDDVLEHVFEAAAWVPAVVVVAGVLATAVVSRSLSGGGTATTEVYVREFHLAEPQLEPRRAPGRLVAAFTTLAGGAPLGMEGPAVYTGAVASTIVHRRWHRVIGDRHHALLVAGAAAGIAAVFKAPAAGAIFALEVPFRGRLAGERVLPAIFGAGSGYVTLAAVDGFEPEAPLPFVDLSIGRILASTLLGLVVGVLARLVIGLIEAAERSHGRLGPARRALVGALGLAGLYAIGYGITDEPVALASGNAVIDWVLDPEHSVIVLVAVAAVRIAGPALAVFGGGVGGLFIPLMAIGAVVGRLFADATSTAEVALFVLVGAACMLGAGYAAPLTGVVFVAEYTGQVAIIVPALVAMAFTVVAAGPRSVSPNQRE